MAVSRSRHAYEDLDLEEVIKQLHSEVNINIDVKRKDEKIHTWTATVSGVDFLDGEWERTGSGDFRNKRQFLKQLKSFLWKS